ncbi:MAG TPA: SBBP repeat-containing protein [Thermoanaerobaculia bacterium]|nr:SBBP repeat-containing protein [Thermoanaerobaculia bacterium]
MKLSQIVRRPLVLLSALLLASGAARSAEMPPASVLGRAPLAFEPNLGQSDPQVRYLARGAGYALFLTREEAVLALPSGEQRSVLRMRPLGAAPAESLEAEEILPGKSHYARLSGVEQPIKDVPRYARVRARAVYPGIDLVYYGNGERLEYDFVVAPGADPGRIRLGFEGAENLAIDEAGDLRLRLAGGELVQPAPVLYQEVGGERRKVAGSFELDGGAVGFRVGAYDPALPLVIDPQLVWASYLGGTSSEWAFDVAVTPNGQAYACGYTVSTDFPTRPHQADPDPASTDAFVTKFNLDGSGIDWSIYLGGPGFQRANAIALDSNRSSYITGTTDELSPGNPLDAFAAQVDAAGNLRWKHIFQAPADTDIGIDIALDASLNSYVVGTTYSGGYPSGNFPVKNAAQPLFGGGSDAFVAKLNRYGTVLYASYYGGVDWEAGSAVTVDGSGRAIFGGDGYTSDPYATDFDYDAFVVRLTAAGSAFQGQIAIAGAGNDHVGGLAVDPSGNVWVASTTYSSGLWTPENAVRRTLNGESDAYLARINTTFNGFSYATYLGNSDRQIVAELLADDAGRLYPVGHSGNGIYDVWMARYIPSTNTASSFTVVASGNDLASGAAMDSSRFLYVAGATTSTDLATGGAFQVNLKGPFDGFVLKAGF